MFGRAPRVRVSTLGPSTGGDRKIDVLDNSRCDSKITTVAKAQEKLQEKVTDKAQPRARTRKVIYLDAFAQFRCGRPRVGGQCLAERIFA